MGWCFGFFFFPAFWEQGGQSIFIVPGWAREQLVSIRCQLGWRLCQGQGGGDMAAAFVCVSEGTAAPRARGRGHREGGCRGGGGSGMPIPFPAGWEVGQEVRQAALISAMPPTPSPGGRWDTAMRGCPTALLLPGDASCYALPASPPSTAAGGATHLQAWGGGEPPEKLKRGKKKKRERKIKICLPSDQKAEAFCPMATQSLH